MWESVDRAVRNVDFNTKNNPHVWPSDIELDELKWITRRRHLATILHPDTPAKEVESHRVIRAQEFRGRKDGRPKKTKPGCKKRKRNMIMSKIAWMVAAGCCPESVRKLAAFLGERFDLTTTIGLGIFTPVLSLIASHFAGCLARTGHDMLAVFASTIGVSVLVVSLSHLAAAIEKITKSATWQAWLYAIALDAGVVLAELVGVYAKDANLHEWCVALMCIVGMFSMALNCYAFLRCPHKTKNGQTRSRR